jgi:hypothetical protein
MAWRRHNRNITHEVFYDGTTIDGSRLEKGMRDIEGDFNDVPIGDMAQRFMPVQYHSGFIPTDFNIAGVSHHWPWMEIRNQATVDTNGTLPIDAPFNELRFKGTFIPGVDLNVGGTRLGTQYAWTRTFFFLRPVVIESLNLLLMADQVTAVSDYMGTENPITAAPYTFTTPPPPGYNAGNYAADVVVILDVFNPTTREDAEMAAVEYTRHRWVINNDPFTFILSEKSNTGPAWDDMFPVFANSSHTACKTLQGRLVEDLDLNIPIPEGSKVRMAVIIPKYDGTAVSLGSWGEHPWSLQGWSTTLTVLEEVRSF